MTESTRSKSAQSNDLDAQETNEAYQNNDTDESYRVRNPGESAEIRWEGEGGHTDE